MFPITPIIAEQAQCYAASEMGLEECREKTGALCVFQVNKSQTYSCLFKAGIGDTRTRRNITCRNLTSVEFCRQGHYCIGGNPHECDRGYFCPKGTADPYDCPFGTLSCPDGLSAYPNEGVVFIILLVIFLSAIGIYWAFGWFRIRNEVSRGWDEEAEAASARKHDTLNEATMRHDQAVVAKAMDDIYSSMAAREKAVTTGKWSSLMEDEDVEAVTRATEVFSNSDMERASDGSSGAAGTGKAKQRNSLSETGRSSGIGQLSASHMRQFRMERERSRMASTLEATMGDFEYDDVALPLTVSCTHMYLTLKVSNKPVLSDICVSIKPFHVTAIMGPSGAGKTSLLSLLRGQAGYANVFGEITVNGHQVESLDIFRRRSAYVPQDDVLNEDLSVEENILYAAMLFNRRGFLRAAEVMPMVLRAEKLLDIVHVRTQVVGSVSRRGISGGQKKRVSIGMELMKEAELFFLDEPTSGLDSASSMLVVKTLHFLASKGVTVGTTIHQPRQEILNLMDNLLLLSPGGRVAYYGPIIDLSQHFSRLHFTCPVGTNIADFVMDTLCGFVMKDNETEVWDVKDTIKYVCDWWAENHYPTFRQSFTSRSTILRGNSKLTDILALPPPEESQRWRYGAFVQSLKVFYTTFDRQAITNFRTLENIFTTCFLLLMFGLIVAFLTGPIELDGTSSGISTFQAQITSGELVFALLIQAASLRLFASDQLLRDREFRAGVPIAPYYLGKLLGNYCEAVFFSLAFMVGYYPFLKARAPFTCYWYVFFLLHISLAGMVNLVVTAYPNNNKATFSVGLVVLFWSFGGVSPTLSVMQSSMGEIATIINTASPFRYSYKVEVINELSRYPTVWHTNEIYDKLDFHPHERDGCIVALACFFVLANALAYMWAEVMYTKPRLLKNFAERVVAAARPVVTALRRTLHLRVRDQTPLPLPPVPPMGRASEIDTDLSDLVNAEEEPVPPTSPTADKKWAIPNFPNRKQGNNPLHSPQSSNGHHRDGSMDGKSTELPARVSPTASNSSLA